MATLAEVLEAIQGTVRAYRTLRAVGRSDGELWRLWVARPDRHRIERVEPYEFKVQVGARWWEYSDCEGGWTGDGEAPSFVSEWPLEQLLDPRPLLASVISTMGETEHAGRRAAHVQVSKRNGESDDDNGLDEWCGTYGDEFEAVIDLTTGVVLRAGSDELIEVHFDEDLPADLFVLPADGPDVPRVELPEPRVVTTLAEAVALAEFTVLVPAVLPEGAAMASCWLAPESQAPWVSFEYRVAPGPRATVHIRQHRDTRDMDDPSRPWQPAGADGVWVRDGPGVMTEVLVRRSGTAAFVQTDLDRDAAVEIGASMNPA